MDLKLRNYIDIKNNSFTQIDWHKYYFYNIDIIKNFIKTSIDNISIGDYIIMIEDNNIIFKKSINWTNEYLKPTGLAYINIKNFKEKQFFVSIRAKSNSGYIHQTFVI